MSVPHPIPYQGSKRRLASEILRYIPPGTTALFEPFCGSAAISLAAATADRAKRFVLSDSFDPLVRLWRAIVATPFVVADKYERIWCGQHGDPRGYYDEMRAEFNRDHDPAKLLFLLARCVKNAVRFNVAGEFNQSPDKRRLGTQPGRMRRSIVGASVVLQGRVVIRSQDYAEAIASATEKDVVYMDPPYQGTSLGRDRRYHQQLDPERFVDELRRLVARNVRVIVSYDGRTGERTYGPELPESLGLERLEIHAGRSSQATLHGESAETVESLYVSRRLLNDGRDGR